MTSVPRSDRYGGPAYGLSTAQTMNRLRAERDAARNERDAALREVDRLLGLLINPPPPAPTERTEK